jgi:hypothetical protein
VSNTSGAALTATSSGVNAPAVAFASSTGLAADGIASVSKPGAGGVQTTTWQLSQGAGATARVATVTVSASGTATPGAGCEVTAQALTTG